MKIRVLLICAVVALSNSVLPAESPDFTRDVEPILRKYCQGCHNAEEASGELRLDSFEQMQKGGEHGPALLAGEAASSRLIRMLTGKAEPAMPPEDEPQPTAEEIALLKSWIDAGAKGPTGETPDPTVLITPQIKPDDDVVRSITAIAFSPDGKLLAVARYREVELLSADDRRVLRTLPDHAGKVNDVVFSQDGSLLLAASGVAGLGGEVKIWHTADGSLAGKFTGHRDAIYAVAISPSGERIATGSYDKKVILWDRTTLKPLQELTQHNGAIFDLAFSPDGAMLASASADETVKLWNTANGERLDTLGQPEGEQLAVLFTPDGNRVIAGGADNRIRVWKVVSRDKPAINPLEIARFAHEGAITSLAWDIAHNRLISADDRRAIKLWETKLFKEKHEFRRRLGRISAIAISPHSGQLAVALADGSLEFDVVPKPGPVDVHLLFAPRNTTAPPPGEMSPNITEVEPNDTPETATALQVPGTAVGRIFHEDRSPDRDLFRFHSRRWQPWVIETKAARSKSPLDTKIEILTSKGRRIEQVKLQAIRDSYFTFRGKDSTQSGDFRVHNWEEMKLNQFLYSSGEVVQLYRYPRGPDSGFDVYPGQGQRWTYFGTPALSHALGEPCYIVQAFWPHEKIVSNGLPVFPIYYENDDDSRRKLGSDSRLVFLAPDDGEYLVRVRDVRGFQGEDFKYELTVRPLRPDFTPRIEGAGLTVNRASGKAFKVAVDRIDDFSNGVLVEFANVPEGYFITSPLFIEPNHLTVVGAIYAKPNAPEHSADVWAKMKVTAKTEIYGQEVTKELGTLGHVKVADGPKLLASLSSPNADAANEGEINELVIAPGETITATLRVKRQGYQGIVGFGGADAGKNLPHGVYIENVGLNGVLLLADQSERTIFLKADDWVEETESLFFLQTDQEGNQCTWPVRLKVRKKPARE